jgi:hypothetical protein
MDHNDLQGRTCWWYGERQPLTPVVRHSHSLARNSVIKSACLSCLSRTLAHLGRLPASSLKPCRPGICMVDAWLWINGDGLDEGINAPLSSLHLLWDQMHIYLRAGEGREKRDRELLRVHHRATTLLGSSKCDASLRHLSLSLSTNGRCPRAPCPRAATCVRWDRTVYPRHRRRLAVVPDDLDGSCSSISLVFCCQLFFYDRSSSDGLSSFWTV